MINYKRLIALGLVGTMGLSMAGCGKKAVDSSKNEDEGTHFYQTEFIDDFLEESASTGSIAFFTEKGFVYDAYDEGYTTDTYYLFDFDTRKSTPIVEISQKSSLENGSTYITGSACDDEGNLYLLEDNSKAKISKENEAKYENATEDDVIKYLCDEWGYESEEDAKAAWEDSIKSSYVSEDEEIDYQKILCYLAATEYIDTYKLVEYSLDGELKNEVELEGLEDDNSLGITSFVLDKDGNVFLSCDDYDMDSGDESYYIKEIDKDGKEVNKIDLNSYGTNLSATSDGEIVISYSDEESDNKRIIAKLDKEKCEIVDKCEFETSDYVNKIQAAADNIVWLSTDKGLYRFDMSTSKSEYYTKWIDNDISGDNIRTFNVADDGTIYVYASSYSDEAVEEIAILTEVDKKDVVKVTKLNIACYYMDYRVKEKAIAFNKKHDDVKLILSEYYEKYETEDESNADDARKQFVTDVTTDDSIDAVIFDNYSSMMEFARKGLTLDMYEYMKNDKTVNKDTVLPNILSVCEYDGKLAGLPTSFSAETLIGKKSDVGDKAGWTIKDVIKLLESKDENTKLLEYTARDEALKMFLSLSYEDFIDDEKGTCNFNNDDFKEYLELANRFPEEIDWESYGDDYSVESSLHDGSVLLTNMYLPAITEISTYKGYYGEDITMIGYPTSSGNGAMLSLSSPISITKNCDDPQTVWDFLSTVYSNNEDYGVSYYGGSILKTNLDKFFDNAIKADDSEFGGTFTSNGVEIKIEKPSKEDLEAQKEVLLNTTAVSGALSDDMYNIISEEAASYFSGEKSVDDVAEVIQSRMEIYINENK